MGTHTCPSIHKFLYHPVTQEMREEEDRKRAQSIIRSQQGKIQVGDTQEQNTIIISDSNFDNFDNFIPADGNSLLSSPWYRSKETLLAMDYVIIQMIFLQVISMSYQGTYIPADATVMKGQAVPPDDDDEDDEESMDWWTKYFASLDTMIEVGLVVFFLLLITYTRYSQYPM